MFSSPRQHGGAYALSPASASGFEVLLLALFISYYSSYLHQTLRMMHMDLDMDLTDLDAESWPKTFG